MKDDPFHGKKMLQNVRSYKSKWTVRDELNYMGNRKKTEKYANKSVKSMRLFVSLGEYSAESPIKINVIYDKILFAIFSYNFYAYFVVKTCHNMSISPHHFARTNKCSHIAWMHRTFHTLWNWNENKLGVNSSLLMFAYEKNVLAFIFFAS